MAGFSGVLGTIALPDTPSGVPKTAYSRPKSGRIRVFSGQFLSKSGRNVRIFDRFWRLDGFWQGPESACSIATRRAPDLGDLPPFRFVANLVTNREKDPL